MSKIYEVHTDDLSNVSTLTEQPYPVNTDHYLVWRGPYAMCVTCPYPHTIPFDPIKFDLKDGKIVRT